MRLLVRLCICPLGIVRYLFTNGQLLCVQQDSHPTPCHAPSLQGMKLPGGANAAAIAAGALAVALTVGPLRQTFNLYCTPAAALVAGFHLLPASGPVGKPMVLGALGGLSLASYGFHHARRARPAHAAPEDELALVTGSSSGIGRSMALELARRGYGVVLVARRQALLEALAEEVRASAAPRSPAVHIVPIDLSQPEAAQRLYEEVVQARGLKVTMLLANAGVGHTEPLIDTSVPKVAELVNLNVLSLTQLARLFGRDMAAAGRGRIMTVSSIAGAAPGPLVSVYAATKAYVTSFTQALQHELEPRGVSVTTLVPGATFTEFAHTSRSNDALVFKMPGMAMPADGVARAGVEGMLRGDVMVVPGLVNKLYLLGTSILPPKLLRKVTELAWSEIF